MSHLTFEHVICLSLLWHSAAITMAIVCAVNEMIIIMFLRKKNCNCNMTKLTVTVSDCCSALRLNCLMSTVTFHLGFLHIWHYCQSLYFWANTLWNCLPDSTGCTARIACGSTVALFATKIHANWLPCATDWLNWSTAVCVSLEVILLRLIVNVSGCGEVACICPFVIIFNQLLSLAHCHHCLSVYCSNLHFRLPY